MKNSGSPWDHRIFPVFVFPALWEKFVNRWKPGEVFLPVVKKCVGNVKNLVGKRAIFPGSSPMC